MNGRDTLAAAAKIATAAAKRRDPRMPLSPDVPAQVRLAQENLGDYLYELESQAAITRTLQKQLARLLEHPNLLDEDVVWTALRGDGAVPLWLRATSGDWHSDRSRLTGAQDNLWCALMLATGAAREQANGDFVDSGPHRADYEATRAAWFAREEAA
ncbi:MAG: hypothetical protein JWM87_748 [Candidatus Eremiobacteraeota bacterium]|nr:hypothetical protein [Candidatus Eremiobacteraeota bacterium]